MNIGIDIDDTITYTYETLLPMIAVKYGMNLNKLLNQKPSYKMLSSILPNYKDFAYNNYSSMARIVPLREGVVDILNKLKEQGHKIIFITARSDIEYKDPYKLSKEYLELNKIPYDKLIVNATDKVKQCIIEKIDLFIDDNTKHCKAVSKIGVDTLHFDTQFTPKIKGLQRVNNWEEVYNIIQKKYA